MPLPFLLPGGMMLGGSILKGLGSLFGQKSAANQQKKFDAQQEAKTLAYRTRQGAKSTAMWNLANAIGKAYGVSGSFGGHDVQDPLASVTPTPYTPSFVPSPSVGSSIAGMLGDAGLAAGQGMQAQMTFDEFMKELEKRGIHVPAGATPPFVGGGGGGGPFGAPAPSGLDPER